MMTSMLLLFRSIAKNRAEKGGVASLIVVSGPAGLAALPLVCSARTLSADFRYLWHSAAEFVGFLFNVFMYLMMGFD